jgi:hypothetical protein
MFGWRISALEPGVCLAATLSLQRRRQSLVLLLLFHLVDGHRAVQPGGLPLHLWLAWVEVHLCWPRKSAAGSFKHSNGLKYAWIDVFHTYFSPLLLLSHLHATR